MSKPARSQLDAFDRSMHVEPDEGGVPVTELGTAEQVRLSLERDRDDAVKIETPSEEMGRMEGSLGLLKLLTNDPGTTKEDKEDTKIKIPELKGKINKAKKELKVLTDGRNRRRAQFARSDYETQGSDANNQCEQALDGFPKDCDMDINTRTLESVKKCTECYICGLPIDSKAKPRKPIQAASYQCEHVLVVTEITLLCGLAADREGAMACTRNPAPSNTRANQFCAYNECIKLLFSPEYLDVEKAVQEEFLEYRRKLLQGTSMTTLPEPNPPIINGSVYQWSHSGCNEIKLNYSFIGITFPRPGELSNISVENKPRSSAIKYVLERLTSREKQIRDGRMVKGWSHEWNWNNYFSRFTLQKLTPDKLAGYFSGDKKVVNRTIQKRIKDVNKNYLQPIIDTLKSVTPKSYYYFMHFQH